MMFGLYGQHMVMYSFKPFGESSKSHDQISDNLLTWAASIGAICNGLIRLLIGSLIDRYSIKLLMTIVLLVELAMCVVFYFAANNSACYFALVVINYTLSGCFYTCIPVSVTRTFGLKLGPQIFVHISLGSWLADWLNLFTTKWFLPATNYLSLYIVAALVTVIALVVLFFIKEELDVENLKRRDAIVCELQRTPQIKQTPQFKASTDYE